MGLNVYLKIFAGLGLFFVGINFLSDHLKTFGKPYIGKIINALASNNIKAMLSGALSGAITNSAKAVTFSLTGFISSGLLPTRRALLIILGASFGSSLLVLWVSIDFKLMELMMLGTAGLLYQFGNMKSERTKFIAGAVLGLGLIFYGLDMLKSGATLVKDNAAFIALVRSAHEYWIAGLLVGAVGAFITQSGASLSIVAITFLDAGVLDFNQTVMLVYGTNIGSGINTALLSQGMNGTSKQMVMYHAAVKFAGCCLLVPALYVEHYADIPLVKALVGALADNQGAQVGMIYVLYEVVSGIAMGVLLVPISEYLERLFPPAHEESLSRPKFLLREANPDVNEATAMIEKEQARLLKRAPRYFDLVRTDIADDHKLSHEVLFEADVAIAKDVQHQLSELLKRRLTTYQTENLLHQHSIHEWISTLDRNLYQLAKLIKKSKDTQLPKEFVKNIPRALNMLLEAAHESLASEDMKKAHMLVETTQRRESLVRRFRPKQLAEAQNFDVESKKMLLEMVNLYERIVWITNNIAHAIVGDLDKETKKPEYQSYAQAL